MTEPTDAEIRELAATGNGVYQDDETAIWEITDPSLMKLVHAALTKWGTPAPQPVAREPLTDEQIKDLQDDDVFFGSCRQIVRAIEAEHGIKGGQHG